MGVFGSLEVVKARKKVKSDFQNEAKDEKSSYVCLIFEGKKMYQEVKRVLFN